jgi:predicted DsbA family dithiol-disulfide isomerase
MTRPMTARAPLRIDFISDLSCPWCAIGLQGLEQAIARLADELPVELHLQPFELNPDIPKSGEPIGAYAARKYGAGVDELARRQALIRQRGAEVGLALVERRLVVNTFDGHRLVHWAGLQGQALAMKKALLAAYHVRGQNLASPAVLLEAVSEARLDVAQALAVLEQGTHADVVRAATRHWQRAGIDSVPSIVIDGRHLIQGGQPAEVFEQALRKIVGEARQPT